MQCVSVGLAALAAVAGPTGADEMQAGRAAEQGGDAPAADAAYRRAGNDPAVRGDAAAALAALYERGGAAASVDQETLGRARAQLGPDFLLTETRNFLVLSDADQRWTRERGVMLEEARRRYFRVMARLRAPVFPHGYKLLCILFKDYDRYRAFARSGDGPGAEWIAGYYSPQTNRIVLYNDFTSPAFDGAAVRLDDASREARALRAQALGARRDGQTQYAAALEASATDLEGRIKGERVRMSDAASGASAAKTVHEAIHLLAFNTGLQSPMREYPFWLSEGLAASFEADEPGGAPGPGYPGAARPAAENTPRTPMSLEQFVGLDQVPSPENGAGAGVAGAELARGMYGRSRTLFAYLYRYRRRELEAYIGSFWAEPPRGQSTGRFRELFRSAFGDPGALERRLRAN